MPEGRKRLAGATGLCRACEIRHCPWPGFPDRVLVRQSLCPRNSLPHCRAREIVSLWGSRIGRKTVHIARKSLDLLA